jgi:hypothetical protein
MNFIKSAIVAIGFALSACVVSPAFAQSGVLVCKTAADLKDSLRAATEGHDNGALIEQKIKEDKCGVFEAQDIVFLLSTNNAKIVEQVEFMGEGYTIYVSTIPDAPFQVYFLIHEGKVANGN